MLEKKFPEVDLNKQRRFIFLISLIMILVLANVAFEWRSYDDFEQIDLRNVLEYEIINHRQVPPSPPLPPKIGINTPKDSLSDDVILSVSFSENYDK